MHPADRHVKAVAAANAATLEKFKFHGPYEPGTEIHKFWLDRLDEEINCQPLKAYKGQPMTFERPKPIECPVCEYDRRFPDFEQGGWMQQDNNGPIVSCPLCNPDGKVTERR